MRSYVIIPARLRSTRLPEKLLLAETGKPLIQHTYEAARRASRPAGVCVAADDQSIVEAVVAFGGEVRMTDPQARSGTDRVAELARAMTDVDIFVNVQGDEPEIEAEAIDQVVALLESRPGSVMSTLATPIRRRELLEDPSCVKVVFRRDGQALYFSRSPIPHPREWSDELLGAEPPHFFQHLGIYGYRRDFLLRLAELSSSRIEQLESLEQLRVLDAGYPIQVGVVASAAVGIDTRADYDAFVSRKANC